MFAKRKTLGLSMSLVAWCSMASLVWAQNAPDYLTITAGVPGEALSTEMRILAWEGALPERIELKLPGETPFQHSFDRQLAQGTLWHEEFTDDEGWTHGTMTLPSPTETGTAYTVSFKQRDNGEVGYEIHPEDRPWETIEGFARLPETLPEGSTQPTPNGVTIIIIVIVIAVAFSCAWAQSQAFKHCAREGRKSCGAFGRTLRSSTHVGACGIGYCRISCGAPVRPTSTEDDSRLTLPLVDLEPLGP